MNFQVTFWEGGREAWRCLDPLFEGGGVQLGTRVLPGFCEVLWLGATLRALPEGRALSLLCHTMCDSRWASPGLGMGTSGIPGLSKTHCLTAENCDCEPAALTCNPSGLHAGPWRLPRATGWHRSQGHSFCLGGGRAEPVPGPRVQAITEFCTELFPFSLLRPGGRLLPTLGPHCNTETTYSCLSN